jgi:hypothetical protein
LTRSAPASAQPLITSELLGYGRDPLLPVQDAVTADCEVIVPIDARTCGFWLKAVFGAPTTIQLTDRAEALHRHTMSRLS